MLGFFGFFGSFEEGALDAVFLDAVAFGEAVFVRRGGAVGDIGGLVTRGGVDALDSVVASAVGARVVSWEVRAWGENAKGLGRGGGVGDVAAGSAGIGVHEVVHGTAGVSASGIEAGAEVGLGHEGGRAWEIFCDLDFNIAQVPLPGCAPTLLLVGVAALGSARWSTLETAIPVMTYERLAFVFLSAAVRVDIVDMRKVGLKLFLGNGDDLIDVKETLAPLIEIRRVLHQLHPTEMSTALFVPGISIVVRRSSIVPAWTVSLLL